jgi:thiamine-phosphate diphosphorylase
VNKKELLSKVQLYVIVDRKICGDKSLSDVAGAAVDGGAQMIQYRDKETDDQGFMQWALRLKRVCGEKDVPFIINDRVSIADRLDADGVHLGEDDLTLKEARRILGNEKIIGRTARDLRQAEAAQEEGADYVGLGPIFPTDSKQIDGPIGVDVIRNAVAALRIPVFAIGGINTDNLDQVIRAGGNRIAVISAVVSSADVRTSAARLLEKLRGRGVT